MIGLGRLALETATGLMMRVLIRVGWLQLELHNLIALIWTSFRNILMLFAISPQIGEQIRDSLALCIAAQVWGKFSLFKTPLVRGALGMAAKHQKKGKLLKRSQIKFR